MFIWLLAGAIPALVLICDSKINDKNNEIHNNIMSTIIMAIFITLCGYISAICIGGYYCFAVFTNIMDKFKKL